MGSNPSRPRPPCPPPPADGASTSSARATFSTAAGDGLMHVDEAGAIGSHRQLAGQRRARAVSSATTVAGAGGRPSFGSSSSSSTPGVPGSPSHAGSSTFGSLFSRRTSPPTNTGDTSPRRKDPKRRRLSGLLSPRGGASGSGAGSGWSSMAASTTKRDKGKQPPPLPRSPGVFDGEPTSRVVNAASTARPGSCVGLLEPVMSSSTEPIVRPTSLSRRPSIGMLGDDIDDVEDGTDPLASPRRRAAQLIERVSMESLRTGLGTAAYVNPLPDVLAPVGTASSGPDPAPEQVHAEATRASDLLSSVLQGYPSPLQRPPTPAVTTGSSPSPPSPSTGQPPTSAPTNRHTHTRGGGTSMVVQGLVTTSRPPTPPRADSRTSSPALNSATATTGRPLRPLPSRLSRSNSAESSTSTGAPAAAPAQTSEEQAALLGGLLSVATTATAASLMRTPRVRPTDPSPVAQAVPTSTASPPASDAGMSPPTLSIDAQRRLAEIRNALQQGAPAAASGAGVAAAATHNMATGMPGGNEDRRNIETVLREYMQGQFGSRPTPPGASSEAQPDLAPAETPLVNPFALPTATSPTSAGSSPDSTSSLSAGSSTGAGPAMPHSFETFLDDIQVDLLRALREYNGLSPEPIVADINGVATASSDPVTREDSSASRLTSSTTDAAPARAAASSRASSNIRPAVTGGIDGVPRNLNFMAAYRFPSRMALARSPTAPGGVPADPRPSSTSPGTTGVQLAPDATAVAGTPSSATSAAAIAIDNGLRRITPMIVVGVRSVTSAEIPAEFGQTTEQAATPTAEPVAARSASLPNLNRTSSAQSTRDPDGDSVMSDATTTSRSSTADGLTGRVRRALDGLRSRVSSSSSVDGANRLEATSRDEVSAEIVRAATERLAAARDERRRGTQSFVLWVIGGRYEDGNPILTAPGLLTGQMTHEELWALAEVIGNVKPPTATAEDISKSALQVISGSQVAEWVDAGRVIASSADRCAICLDDYEADQDCRVMSCKHIYHQTCIDSWLSIGRNACPACRTKGVPTAGDDESRDTPATAAGTAATDAAADVAA